MSLSLFLFIVCSRKMKQRDCEAEPEPTYVSLTIGDLVKRLKSTGDETSEGYDTKSEGYKTGGESDFEDEQEQVAKPITIFSFSKHRKIWKVIFYFRKYFWIYHRTLAIMTRTTLHFEISMNSLTKGSAWFLVGSDMKRMSAEFCCGSINHCRKKKWFPLRVSSVYVTKSAVSWDLATFIEEILNQKLQFLCSKQMKYEICQKSCPKFCFYILKKNSTDQWI